MKYPHLSNFAGVSSREDVFRMLDLLEVDGDDSKFDQRPKIVREYLSITQFD